MSTRATYEFKDKDGTYTIYKHCDGYPEYAIAAIAAARDKAWPLPRFEADEFAAAFVAANKHREGGVYLTTGKEAHEDTVFHYVVTCSKAGRLHVLVERRDGLCVAAGTIDDLVKFYCPGEVAAVG